MMSLIARAPSTLSFSASESPLKSSFEIRVPGVRKLRNMTERNNPLSAVTHVTSQWTTTNNLLNTHTHSARYSEWDADQAWSSQEWKSDELMDDRMVKPVGCPRGGAQQFVIEDDETESELSLGSRSFLHRENDQVRKKAKTIFNGCDRRQRQTFCDMVNVYVFYIASICNHETGVLRKFTFHQKIQGTISQ